MELSEETKSKLREIKEQYRDIIESWSTNGSQFERTVATIVIDCSK